ncbi:MAG: tRNA (N6-isopentenyl adenosine(37)-C2)-methylthiotransferase MiaB [Firmicutes bacterium]|nr:tRNA (N6-isopentenyl adenosine(37)-C2)-methylthiotransferase MiaB [Bacillota bacterium]
MTEENIQREIPSTPAELTVHRPTIAKRDALMQASPVRPDLVGAYAGKHYMLRTYGCQMNEHDSEIMAGLLETMGYRATDDEATADLILFNTCAVRENAENKVFGEVGRLVPFKNRNPELLLGVCGCMPQEKVVQEKIQKTYPWIDLVFGTHNLHRLPELVEQARHSQETVMEIWEEARYNVDDLPKARKEGVRAWVNIQYGCNKFCTYCIVPYTRGRERSRTIDSIVEEVQTLVAQGFREITLLGQNVNDYGLDLGDVDFADLLRAVANVAGIERVRFTTSNPWNFTDKLITAIAESEHICKQIHLPVQSGSNEVLRKMNRGYTREYYLKLVERIRKAIPDVALSTDIIVGFPGETQKEFDETLSLLQEVQFEFAYTFIYSPRVGTPAAKFADDTASDEKKERLQVLMDVQNSLTRMYSERLIGQTVDVLIEGTSRTNDKVLAGRTESNRIVLISAPKSLVGSVVTVHIDSANTWTLYGTVVGQAAAM